MELKSSEKMILDALSAAVRNEKSSFEYEVSETDWQEFFSIANEQKILPLVFASSRERITESVAKNAVCYKSAVICQVSAQTVKTAAFLDMYGFLTENGVHPVVVKGIVCRSLYPSPDSRISRDEDIIVHDDEWNEAVSLLGKYGMTADEQYDSHSYEIAFRNDDLTVELHRTLFSDTIPAFEGFNSFFESSFDSPAEYPTDSGKTVLSLSPQDHLLFLILHAYKHFVRSGFGIRQICDIGLWAEKYSECIDWDMLFCRLVSVRGTMFFASILKIAREYIKCDFVLPEKFNFDIDPIPMLCDVFSGGIYGGEDPGRKSSGFGTLNAVSSDRKDKKSSAFSLLFPPRYILASNYPELEDHPARLPIVWMKRIFKRIKRNNNKNEANPSEIIKTVNERKNILRYYQIIE